MDRGSKYCGQKNDWTCGHVSVLSRLEDITHFQDSESQLSKTQTGSHSDRSAITHTRVGQGDQVCGCVEGDRAQALRDKTGGSERAQRIQREGSRLMSAPISQSSRRNKDRGRQRDRQERWGLGYVVTPNAEWQPLHLALIQTHNSLLLSSFPEASLEPGIKVVVHDVLTQIEINISYSCSYWCEKDRHYYHCLFCFCLTKVKA